MPSEMIFQAIYAVVTLASVVFSIFIFRGVLLAVATDLTLQKTKQEELDFEDHTLHIPENVIPLPKRSNAEPFKKFVEDFLFFEIKRDHKGMVDYAVGRTRLIHKAGRLLGK